MFQKIKSKLTKLTTALTISLLSMPLHAVPSPTPYNGVVDQLREATNGLNNSDLGDEAAWNIARKIASPGIFIVNIISYSAVLFICWFVFGQVFLDLTYLTVGITRGFLDNKAEERDSSGKSRTRISGVVSREAQKAVEQEDEENGSNRYVYYIKHQIVSMILLFVFIIFIATGQIITLIEVVVKLVTFFVDAITTISNTP